MNKQLESSNPKVSYLDLNDRQMRWKNEVQFKVLDELIKVAAGSSDIDVQE